MAWEGSDRRLRLPADWKTRRLRVLRRDGYRCQITDDHGVPCLAWANEVDHIERGDDHDEANLRAACSSCHAKKSASEGAAARESRRFRPREQHPGMI
jgi:5-methylcytosine-specific restriction endonuclease McrA